MLRRARNGGDYSPGVLNAEKDDTDQATADSAPPSEAAAESRPRRPLRRLKLLATLFGLLGTVLSLAVPFLPVTHEITTLRWPTASGTTPVSAPLVTFSPVWLDAQIPCSSAQDLDARTNGPATLLSTNPPDSDYGRLTGLTLQVDNGLITLLTQGKQINTVPIPAGGCALDLHSDAVGFKARVGDNVLTNIAGDHRPQLTGIYSDLNARTDQVDGLSFEAQVDNRFESSPTALKLAVIALALVAFVASVVCLRKLDTRAGRRPPRWVQPGWWKPTLPDVAVIGSLLIWWLIGAMSSDDGYTMAIARARESAGYISNYYRWFANPEAPWGWFYEVYALWVKVSTAIPWMRLPALLMALVSWMLISREVLPRLGQQVRRSQAAGWAAAAVFLAFWLPYNNGLRSEPVIVVFSLAALCAVERAVATSRLMPAALGLVVAALAVGAGPHGIVAVLPFVAALKPLLKLLGRRVKEFGWLPVLAPISAAGFVVLNLLVWDQTWQTISEATSLKIDLGPSEKWYQELNRYNMLFSPIPDGSLTRRFPVLLVILCLVTCAVVLLRRNRIRGAALGPSRRLLAVAGMSFVALAMTQTKHTHHFGIFAAVGGALAALTALATSTTVLRSRRNRAAFFSGLMVICAFSATGPNAWWYVSGWGVRWSEETPKIGGYEASTLLLAVALIAAIIAFVEHVRADKRLAPPGGVEHRSRALRLGTAPLSLLCALLILSELAAFGAAVEKRAGGYSLGGDNINAMTGGSCGLSDYVYAETNPQAGMLKVADKQPAKAAPAVDPDVPVPSNRLEGEESPEDYLNAKLTGFNRSGLPPGNGTTTEEPDWKPPYQFGGDNAPVWGSYTQRGTGELRTQWYDVPQRAASGEVPIVLAMAGIEGGANSLAVEFGKDSPEGFQITDRRYLLQPGGPNWRDKRLVVDGKAEGTTKMRIVAVDQSVSPRGWQAVSAPRAPQLTNMTDVVGDSPTFVDWSAAFVHPCLQLSGLNNGIAEMPRFRVAGGAGVRAIGQGWSSPDKGGPFGWMNVTASMRELPTYMKDDLNRDWGTLYAVDPYEPSALPAEAAMRTHQETHWGTWTPGPLPRTVSLPGDVPSSDDRNDIRPLDAGTGSDN
ncbi:MAG: arabinosyltransferase domain-containing protein [Saccharopolyspora sp.]|uniref:arabinosyltransferase domain-containing protein n=1 Tax=Saccharopolyspora sp. SCSIO 74807 TaxID=3118084 RepID=UPI00387E7A66|nr:arabinosyltransferase domain-containing protein [Saccharopolyspora sp.]